MAKGKRTKKTAEEKAAIEKDRMAAHGVTLTDEQAMEAVETGKVEVDYGTMHGQSDPVEVPPQQIPREEAQEVGGNSHGQEAMDGDASVVMTEELREETKEKIAEIEGEEEEKRITSVVADKYKDTYIANAKVLGIGGKAAKRSNWDWLAETLAKHCLGEKEKIDIDRFKEVLDLNGVDHSKWTNRNKGWEGRFRMTGRVVLQKKVADANCLYLPGNVEMTPPPEFVSRFKTKA